MSLINLLKAPSKLLKKHVITFLLIRRHDLGLTEQSLRYVAVRPSASVSRLRRKIWYLLDLPDYCDEVIVLKSSDEREIPLTSLCRGNDPQHPYILEVWLPEKPMLLTEQSLRYVAVRPSASVSRLRRKIWYLLDLPDYCDEVIVLKSSDEREIPLTSLCRGNDPQHPYILEVWLPEKPMLCISAGNKNMLTVGNKKSITDTNGESQDNIREETLQEEVGKTVEANQKTVDSTGLLESHRLTNILHADQKRSDLSFKFSNSSLFFKIPRRNSADSFTGILLKIQNDLSTLSSKLTHLENKIHV
ncbi:hypothetical protein RR48_07463 [Papilio machaon]|uniref:Uncharacterized protein n=1 Tax=Papilio machaon TaxID=76193 RepID=A0A194RR42_PAPMA|nr:hypothetical protein RR48_07463 [Papilio machaon]